MALGLGLGLSRTSFVAELPLLDTYSGAAAAYSLRKLRTAYSGSAIRVRRSSDNTEQDIGFTASGDLDQSALTTFTGASDGFVVTIYDQANSNDYTRPIPADQPQIVSAGSVILENGLPTLDINSLYFLEGEISTTISYPATVFSVQNFSDNTSQFAYNLQNDGRIQFGIFSLNYRLFSGTAAPAGAAPASASQTLASALFNTTASTLHINGSQVGGTLNAGNVTGTINDCVMAANDNGNSPVVGTMQELIIYISDQSANRTAIEANIKSYYSIY